MGEDVTGMATTTSQLQAKLLALTGGQVDIMADATTFKNSTQILREMAEAWKDMDDISRASALELMGGKRQANVLSALIQNFDTVEDAIETSANSAGSAIKENERYLDSIQGKIDQFNNAMQAMWSDTLDSDVVKKFIELGTALIKILDAVGPLNVAFVGLFTFLEKKYGLIGNLFKQDDSLEGLKKQLEKAKKDLEKASDADLRHGTNKTAEKRRNAEERVNILKQKVQEASEEAVLEGIDESFDPDKAKNRLRGKKSARTARINKLQAEGRTFDEIQVDPHVQQYTKDIEEAEQALSEYNATMQRVNATSQQASATTQVNTAATSANAAANNAAAAAETADATATAGSTVAEVADTTATTTHTAATWADVRAEMTKTGATGASVAATIKQVLATKLATLELVKKGAAEKHVMATDLATLGVTKLLTLGFYGLVASLKTAIATMWTFMTTTPIGWILAIVAAVVALGAAFASMHKTTAELQEELDGFKSKLSDVRSELDSVNQELETTNERMDELLAKDKLTFEEQEELDRLRATNDELERRKELLEDEEEYQSGRVGRQAARVVESAKNDTVWSKAAWDLNFENDKNEHVVLERISSYASIKEKMDNATSLTDRDNYQKKLDKEATKIDEYLQTLSEALDGVEYGDSDESDAALDYLAEIESKYAIARGSANAKSSSIKGILKKPEFKSMSNAIDYYVQVLKDGDASAAESIKEIINNNEDFVAALQASGLEAEDAIKLYTELGQSLSFNTLEGKTEELKRATAQLPEALNNIEQFIDDGDVDTSAIAEYFKGTSSETRDEIAKLIKQINEGEISVEAALKQFELFGIQSTLQIEITEVQSNFADVFTDLEGADGLIDTFEELADAIGSTSGALDAFNAAQAEMAGSGRVSIETALKLMEYTDDYSKVLKISEGKLVLAEDAEENLIEARLEGMKASALKALEEAKAARETIVASKSNAEAALSTYNSAMQTEMAAAVTASAWDKVLAAAAGLLAGIQSLFTGGSWTEATEAYDRAYQETISSRGDKRVEEVENKYTDAEEQAKRAQLQKDIEDADKALEEQDKTIEKLQGNSDLINGLTKDNIGEVFKSDGYDNPDDVENDAFQREMDYWENRIAANRSKRDQIQNEIDLLESKGMRAGEEYYNELIAIEEERKALLIAQRDEALAYLSTQEEGSEEWWNAAKIVNDLEDEIDDCTASIQDFADAQAQIKWDNLEEITSRFSDLHDEVSDLRDILQREDMFDSDGNWTESGAGVLGTYVYDLEAYKNELATLQAEIADLQAHPYNEANAAYLKETYGIDSEQEYNDLVTQWNKTQRDLVKGAYDTADAIKDAYSQQVDAIEDAINEQIDAYNDYIDVVKDAYDAERELYEFKKDIQKQSKSIAETERKIASLSGSTNAADIAERRKLEAQLAEQRESINDSYYSYANDQRSNALDHEAQAYEESMSRYVEGLRETLEEQAQGLITFTETGAMVTNEFLNGVMATVMQNAGLILEKYEEVSPYMSDKLKQPWIDASAQLGQHGNDLSVLNDWISDSGYFGKFKTTASGQITTPFANGSAAASAFKTSTTNAMDSIASNVRSNVPNITSNLGSVQSAYSGIITSAQRAKAEIEAANAAAAAGASYTGTAANPSSAVVAPQQVDSRILSKYKLTSDQVLALGYGPISLEKFEDLLRTYQIKYSAAYATKQVANMGTLERAIKKVINGNYVSGPMAIRQYAKGTYGTERDEWAITDEHKFGDELVLVPGKDGNLSFMRKGTGVVPADMTQKLWELAQIPTSDLMNKNLTAIVPDITRNDFKNEFHFESLVHVDTVDSDTLPKLEKMVDKKIDDFSKALNYSIKRFTR